MPTGAITLADITSTDWSLSLDTSGLPGSGIGNVVQGLADVDQCIHIILTTPQGSDPLRPTFATNLWQFIDYPINAAIPAIVGEVTRALSLWEPRIRVITVTAAPVVNTAEQPGSQLRITVTWQLKLVSGSGSAALPSSIRTTLIMIPTGYTQA